MTPPGLAPVAACDPGSRLPPFWWQGGFMQVFVRAFRDGNGDGVGDLRGLTEALPYLHDLGVSGLWLMPLHPSQDGDHGYAVTDYRAIAPEYGTLADFDALLAEAHARGIGVILDYVPNHSAASHPLFQHASASRDSPWRDWYVWCDEQPQGWWIHDHDPWRGSEHGWYFGAFSERMPDFNWRCPEVEAWHHHNLRFWLNRGVDGFRFDACGHLVENGPDAWDCQPESMAIMARMRALLDGYTNRYMVCEAPGDPQGFARAAGSAFAFDLNGCLIDAALGRGGALARVAAYFDHAKPSLATMLSNHDHFAGARVHDQLQGHAGRLRVAAALNLMLPGSPFIYYGEEVGMGGIAGASGDVALRAPMSWAADPHSAGFSSAPPFRRPAANVGSHNVEQARADPGSLHAVYRRLLGWRRARASLTRGDWQPLECHGPGLSVLRRLNGEATLLQLNTGEAAWTPRPPAGHLVPLGHRAAADAPLAPHAFRLYALTA